MFGRCPRLRPNRPCLSCGPTCAGATATLGHMSHSRPPVPQKQPIWTRRLDAYSCSLRSQGPAVRPFKVTLKNYRCFEDTKPLSLEVGPGFTALVGPKNSGKSSFLKFFYEARPLFGTLVGNVNEMRSLVNGPTRNVSFQAVDDQVEIFYNRNTRPLVIELELPATT